MKKKPKATGGTFSLVYHTALSEPLRYDATSEEIDKVSRRLIAKVRRKERVADESTPRATRGRVRQLCHRAFPQDLNT